MQRLVDIDYRKSLITHRMMTESFSRNQRNVQALSHTIFECISTENFDELVPADFLLVGFKYDYPK